MTSLTDPLDLGWALAPEPARSRRPAPPAPADAPRALTTEEIDDGWYLPDDALDEPTQASHAPQPAPQPAPLDLNSATAEQLCTVPGIARLRASRILALRERMGRFASVDDLVGVQGLGRKTVAALRPYLTVADD